MSELREVREHAERIVAVLRAADVADEAGDTLRVDHKGATTLLAAVVKLTEILPELQAALAKLANRLQPVVERETLVPNAETREALAAAERGEGAVFANLDELFADLNSPDAEC
jgi:hypothetical protein